MRDVIKKATASLGRRNALLMSQLLNALWASPQNSALLPVLQGKAAIYARVALDENNALEKQIAYLKEAAACVGDDDCAVYAEVASGITKDRAHRKELYKLLSDVKSGLISRIYIKSCDRISRNAVFEMGFEEMLRNYDAELVDLSQEVV